MDGINQKNESIRTISLSGTMRGDIETIGKDISAGSSVLKQTTTVQSVFRELVFRGRSGFRGLRFLKTEFSRAKRIWI